MIIRKSLYNYFEIIKSLANDEIYKNYIIIKGSSIYLNVFKHIKRHPSDIDFCLAIDCDLELKKQIIREIISRCSYSVELCDNFSSPNQFGIVTINDSKIKLESNTYSPVNREFVKRAARFGDDKIMILTYSIETMVVDKLFSLFYFVHPLFNGKNSRLYEAFYDIGIIVKDRKFIKLLKTKKIENAIKHKIKENIFGSYGLAMYIDFFEEKSFNWKINRQEIRDNYENYCRDNHYDNSTDFLEIINVLEKVKQRCMAKEEIIQLIKIWEKEAKA